MKRHCRDFVIVLAAGVALGLLLSAGQVAAAELAPGPEATTGASTSQRANYHADYHADYPPTTLRTVPRARRTTPLRDATSGAISSATGETRPAWIVTGGRAWAGRADTHACSSLHRAR